MPFLAECVSKFSKIRLDLARNHIVERCLQLDKGLVNILLR